MFPSRPTDRVRPLTCNASWQTDGQSWAAHLQCLVVNRQTELGRLPAMLRIRPTEEARQLTCNASWWARFSSRFWMTRSSSGCIWLSVMKSDWTAESAATLRPRAESDFIRLTNTSKLDSRWRRKDSVSTGTPFVKERGLYSVLGAFHGHLKSP